MISRSDRLRASNLPPALQFPESDSKPKDGARFFYPSTEVVFAQLDGHPFVPVAASNDSQITESITIDPSSINSAEAYRQALKLLKGHPPAIEGNGGDAHTLQTAMRLMDLGIGVPEQVCELLMDSGWNDRCHPPWDSRELLKKCVNAARSRKNPVGVAAAEQKPTITIVNGQLYELTVKCERALVSSNSELYARGPLLVEPLTEEVDASDGRKTFVTRMKVAKSGLIKLRLSQYIDFRAWNGRQKDYVPVDPPKEVAESILLMDGEWGFRRLAGIITCPTLRRDGSILETPGYDPKTGLLLLDPPKLPEIPTKPTKDDAARALKLLEALLLEFPCLNPESRSVLLSMLISVVVRGALSAVPLHVVRATTAGSGKSYSTDLASILISGQACPVVAAGRNEEETEKRLGAILMRGQPIVNIDNVNGELGGDALCQIVERPFVQIRILGKSEVVLLENKSTVFATGNGIVLTGDMTRRVVVCSLDANLERPELRQFKLNPVDALLENRGLYVAAVLTVARAYFEAGFPERLPDLASFGDWSRVVRSLLVWLGRADPIETMKAARAEDPHTLQFERFVFCWKSAYGVGGARKTAGEVAKDFGAHPATYEGEADTGFHEVLKAIAPNRSGNIDSIRLGKWLVRNEGRIALSLKLVGVYDSHLETKVWRLDEPPPMPGVAQENSND